MKFFFHPDSPITKFLTKMADLIILNVLWVIGCLPVFTVGASSTALCDCIVKYRKYGDISLWKGFWSAYRLNFKKSTILMLVMILLSGIFLVNLRVLYALDMGLSAIEILMLLGFALLVFPAMCYVFPLQAQFENSVWQTLQNAWLISLIHLPASLVILGMNMIPLLLLLFDLELFLKSIMVWLFFGFAVTAFLNDMILQRVFAQYYPQKEQDN